MLTKKELRLIKIPTLHKNQYCNLVWSDSNTFIVRSRIERKGNILIVAFYSVKYPTEKPVYTLYLTKDESITLDRSDFFDIEIERNYHKKRDNINPKEKWLTGNLSCYVNTYASVNYGNEQDYIRICNYQDEPASEKWALRYLNDFQATQKDLKLYKKKEFRLKDIDNFMKCVPSKLPKGLNNWITKVPLLNSRYIIYVRETAKKASGYCTHCKKEVDLSHLIPRHMETGVCPVCKSKIQFLSRGKMKHHWWDKAFCAVAQRTKDNKHIVFSFLEICKHYYKKNIKNPETYIIKEYRIFTDLSGKIIGCYHHRNNSYTGTRSWYPKDFMKLSGNNKYYYSNGMYHWELKACYEDQQLYPHNFKKIIQETAYEHFPSLSSFTKLPGDITTTLENAQVSHVRELIEKLTKVGLTNLAEWFTQVPNSYDKALAKGVTFEGRKLHQKLGLTKDYYRLFRENNYTIEAFDCIKQFQNITLSPYQMDYLLAVGSGAWYVINKLLSYTTLDRIIFYTTNKVKDDEYLNMLTTWNDYLEMCGKLEMVLWYPQILFPVNLNEEHDRVMSLVVERENGVFVRKIKKRYPELKQAYEYEDKNYKIVVPCSYSEIAREAKRLNNCLIKNGYYKKHADSELTLLFLRKKENPDKAFFCFAMSPDERILSIEGYQQLEYETKNRIRPSNAENSFLEKWQLNKCKQYAIASTSKRAA